MIKCFWCGAENDKASDFCCGCRRKLQWSNFLRAILRPSVGCLVGEEHTVPTEEIPAASTALLVG